jgi:putative membrane protein
VSPPTLITLPFESWSISWTVTGISLLAAATYLVAARRASAWRLRWTLGYLAGLLAINVALQSGIDAYDDRLLSDHMVQHLLLIEVAPALLLYARPVELALKVLHAPARRTVGRALVATRGRATPPLCLSLFAVLVLGAHVPAFFDAAVRHQALHEAEHVAYLLAGLLVWWPLLGDPAPKQRLGAIGRLAYITLAMLPMTLIGGYLNRRASLFYPVYAAPTRALGVTPVLDQQRAGAIMWVAGTTLMACVGLYSVLTAMLAAERRQHARELHEVSP